MLSVFVNIATTTVAFIGGVPQEQRAGQASESTPLTDSVLYEADTSGGFEEWSTGGGWKTVSGMIVNDGSTISPAFVSAPFELPLADYAIEVELQWVRDGTTFGIIARGGDEEGYWAGFHPGGDRCSSTVYGQAIRRSLQLWGGPAQGPCGEDSRIDVIDVGLDSDWHTYRMEVEGNTIRVLIDDEMMIETTDNRFLAPGQVGLWSNGAQVSVRRFTIIPLGS